jgi:hypothetical protein
MICSFEAPYLNMIIQYAHAVSVLMVIILHEMISGEDMAIVSKVSMLFKDRFSSMSIVFVYLLVSLFRIFS